MNNEQINSNKKDRYLDILSSIKTDTDAVQFSSSLNKLAFSLYETRESINQKISRFLSNEQKDKIILYCKEHGINIDDLISFQKFISELDAAVKNLPKITLFLAYDPRDESVSIISDWFILNLKQKILLNIEVDKKIIGGAVIVYKGIYKNYSLKNKLDRMLSENKLNFNYLQTGEVNE